jgi:metallo-beta-lactamase family protein
LQEEEADYRNRHNLTSHAPALPLYDENDAKDALNLLNPVANNGEFVQVTEGVSASFRVAGHILGASQVLVNLQGAKANGSDIRFLFSGDLGHYDQPIVNDPAAPPNCDYLMCESTYGNRLHGNESSEDQFAEMITHTAKRNAPILIPAFAIGRTQEVLYMIRELEDAKRIPILPVIVDSPMAAQATQVYNRFAEEHDEEYASILRQKRHPLRTGSMMSGGRVLHHAMRILPNKNATLVFVGYQAAGTTGRRIQNGEREVRIMKQWIPVNCHIVKIEGFSAHADWKAVLRWLKGLRNAPTRVFTTHGEPEAAEAMAGHIRDEYGWTVEVPTYGETFELK